MQVALALIQLCCIPVLWPYCNPFATSWLGCRRFPPSGVLEMGKLVSVQQDFQV